MKVYIVTAGSEARVVAVFSERSKADEFIDRYNTYNTLLSEQASCEEWEVNGYFVEGLTYAIDRV